MFGLSFVLTATCVPITAVVWLTSSIYRLSRKKNELILADKQLEIYSQRSIKAMDGPQEQLALEQVELSREIYQNVAVEYNRYIARVTNRPVAWILGYHTTAESWQAR